MCLFGIDYCHFINDSVHPHIFDNYISLKQEAVSSPDDHLESIMEITIHQHNPSLS